MFGRRLLVPLIVVGSVGAGTVAGAVIGVPGLSGASTQNATTQAATKAAPAGPRSGLFAAAANALHLTTDQLRQKLSDGKTTIADVAKQQNVDVNTVIDALAAADRQRIEDFVNKPLPKVPTARPHTPGLRGPAIGLGPDLSVLAQALGIDSATLRNELRNGTSIAQIAKDHNVDVNKVIDALVNAASARIDQAVKNGKITQQQADKATSNLRDRITKLVNGEWPGKGMLGPSFPWGRAGRGGPQP